MKVEFKPAFERSIKQFPSRVKEEIKQSVVQLVDILSRDKHVRAGIGLKRLRADYWEMRKGLKVRILFRWQGDLIEFILAGNHDNVKRFLKNIN